MTLRTNSLIRTPRTTRIAPFALVALCLSACTQPADSGGDAISRDGSAYDGVAADAHITLHGNEPFWRLEITPDAQGYTGSFATPDGEIDASPFAMSRFAGNNGLGFSGELAGEAVQVALTPGECEDSMADRTYAFTATVSVGDRLLIGCGDSEGQDSGATE